MKRAKTFYVGFKGKTIALHHNPRTGVCKICGRMKGKNLQTTHMHHFEYHEDDPLRATIEVCVSCHKKLHSKAFMSQMI